MLTNPQIPEFLMNSDKISWILREFLPEFWCSKVRLVRSLAHRTFQPWDGRCERCGGLKREPEGEADQCSQSGTNDGWGGGRLVSANFRRLVLFCIEADLCVQILIFQHFSRSTGFAYLRTAPNSEFQQIFVDFFFSDFSGNFRISKFGKWNSQFFGLNFADFCRNFAKFVRI